MSASVFSKHDDGREHRPYPVEDHQGAGPYRHLRGNSFI